MSSELIRNGLLLLSRVSHGQAVDLSIIRERWEGFVAHWWI
jgi:hypothetical protein